MTIEDFGRRSFINWTQEDIREEQRLMDLLPTDLNEPREFQAKCIVCKKFTTWIAHKPLEPYGKNECTVCGNTDLNVISPTKKTFGIGLKSNTYNW